MKRIFTSQQQLNFRTPFLLFIGLLMINIANANTFTNGSNDISIEKTVSSCEFFPETFGTEILLFTDVPQLYDWYFVDFGDGTVTDTIYVESDGPTTLHNSHNYADIGEYRVCLTTQSEGNTCTSCQSVSIEAENNDECNADFSVIENPRNQFEYAFFARNYTEGIEYQWTLDNEFVSADSAFSHVFDDSGIYQMSLTVYHQSQESCTSTKTLEVALDETQCVVEYDYLSNTAVVFYPHLAAADSIYSIDFGDGTVINEVVNEDSLNPSVSHSYTETGHFLVVYKVVSRGGATCEKALDITIDSADSSCEFFPEIFGTEFLLFTDVPQLYDWYLVDFGDGTVTDTIYVEVDGPTTLQTSHNYADPG
ncbi:MAG: hypothetical protein AAFO69_17685, partial [Bacteroidota bacterium]